MERTRQHSKVAGRDRANSPRLREWIVNGVLIATLGGVILQNMPDSEITRRARPAFRPWVNALGLDQRWNLFSPDPARRSIFIEARLDFADGSRDTVRAPSGGPWITDKRFYRWRKWQRRVRLDSKREHWPAAALYLGGPYLEDPRGLLSIALVRRWSDTPRPGSGEPRRWREYEFFELAPGPGWLARLEPAESAERAGARTGAAKR